MIQVDFLPASYKDKKASRNLRLWRVVVVALIGGVVVFAAAYQQYLVWKVDGQIAELAPQYEMAAKTMDRLKQLSSELDTVGDRAELYTYLRHPWPRTQILAALVGPLPDSVEFDELRMVRESLATTYGEAATPAATPEEAAKVDPAVRDLEKLRRIFDQSRLVVTVTGTTTNVVELHKYLGQAGHAGVFQRAKLKSIEAIGEKPEMGSRFAAEFFVRPGYGQPAGPAVDPSSPPAESISTKSEPEDANKTLQAS